MSWCNTSHNLDMLVELTIKPRISQNLDMLVELTIKPHGCSGAKTPQQVQPGKAVSLNTADCPALEFTQQLVITAAQ